MGTKSKEFRVFEQYGGCDVSQTLSIRYQILFFTPYQSPAYGCKLALCTQNQRHEKTSSGVSYTIRTNPACSVTKTRFQFELSA